MPSEAEWQYASAGGTQNRKYAWGPDDPGANTALAVYGCYWNGTGSCTGLTNIAPVGSVPAGNGRWGQSDLAGSVWEWTLDWYTSPYPTGSCNSCATTASASHRVVRGGSFYGYASDLTSAPRYSNIPTTRDAYLAGRCARSP